MMLQIFFTLGDTNTNTKDLLISYRNLYMKTTKLLTSIAASIIMVGCNSGGGGSSTPGLSCNGNANIKAIGNAFLPTYGYATNLSYFAGSLYMTYHNSICSLNPTESSPEWDCSINYSGTSGLSEVAGVVLDSSGNMYTATGREPATNVQQILKYNIQTKTWQQIGSNPYLISDYPSIKSNMVINNNTISFNLMSGSRAGILCSIPVSANQNTSWSCNAESPLNNSPVRYLSLTNDNIYFNQWSEYSGSGAKRQTYSFSLTSNVQSLLGQRTAENSSIAANNDNVYVVSSCFEDSETKGYKSIAYISNTASANATWSHLKIPTSIDSIFIAGMAATESKLYFMQSNQAYEVNLK